LRVAFRQRPRVLYISLPSGFSGAEESLCSLIEKIDQTRFELFALTSVSGFFSERLRELGVHVICPEANLGEPTIQNLHYADALFHRIRPQIVHLNGQEALPFVFRLAMTDLGVVQHVRNGDLTGFEEGIILSDSVIAVSEFIKNEIMAFPVSENKIKVIYDEVDSGKFLPNVYAKAQARRELGIPEDSLVALMVARVAPNKRHDVMLRAAATIKKEIPSFHLVIKGDLFTEAPIHDQLKLLIEDLKLGSYLTWLGFVPDIRKLIATADVMVLCSDREGLGRCIVEGMSMEIPVVVSDTGGTHELISSGTRGGFVVPGNDSQALAARVVELLRSPTLRTELGKRGREYVVEHLDARISAEKVMNLYDQVLCSPAVQSACNQCLV
jgi:glycosyltransferase involved in cell wall biosynthesis